MLNKVISLQWAEYSIYRPISLSSFLIKALERLVNRFIRDKVLSVTPLSGHQYAYQPERSTDAALDDLNRLLSKSLEDKDIAELPSSTRGLQDTICEWVEPGIRNRINIFVMGQTTLIVKVGRGIILFDVDNSLDSKICK